MAATHPIGTTVEVVEDMLLSQDSRGDHIIKKGERGVVIHSGPCEWGDDVVIVVFEHLYESLGCDNTMHFPENYPDAFSEIRITGHSTGSIESVKDGNFTLAEVTAFLAKAGVASPAA